MRTVTIDYEETVHITLTRPSLADARVRVALAKALGTDEDGHEGTWCYYVTMILSAEGTGDRKLTVCPSVEEVRALYERWVNETDEALARMIVTAISQLIAPPSLEKKASGASSENTSAKVLTQNP